MSMGVPAGWGRPSPLNGKVAGGGVVVGVLWAACGWGRPFL